LKFTRSGGNEEGEGKDKINKLKLYVTQSEACSKKEVRKESKEKGREGGGGGGGVNYQPQKLQMVITGCLSS
jgi:hypothetical protein